jgi:hypothetical protein
MALKLYNLGFRNIQMLRENNIETQNNDFERLKFGLTYFEDLNENKITRDECFSIFENLKSIILNEVDKQCVIELVGGFRRDKQTGHDIDLLITHPVDGEENGILTKIIETLGYYQRTNYFKIYSNFSNVLLRKKRFNNIWKA